MGHYIQGFMIQCSTAIWASLKVLEKIVQREFAGQLLWLAICSADPAIRAAPSRWLSVGARPQSGHSPSWWQCADTVPAARLCWCQSAAAGGQSGLPLSLPMVGKNLHCHFHWFQGWCSSHHRWTVARCLYSSEPGTWWRPPAGRAQLSSRMSHQNRRSYFLEDDYHRLT